MHDESNQSGAQNDDHDGVDDDDDDDGDDEIGFVRILHRYASRD